MDSRVRPVGIVRTSLALVALLTLGAAAPVPQRLIDGLEWRNVGPFRGGRISAASGVIGDAGTYYVGTPAGGVWKTTSAGAVWTPVFDGVKNVSSIGALEVAPSDGNVIYVGTGDQVTGGVANEGNGMYKSADGGRTWTHLGLGASKHIPSIVVDPRNPDVVLVAAKGNSHTRNTDRGVYRSANGGRTWTQTLFIADTIGVQKLAIAYDRPDVVYATTIRWYAAPLPANGVPPAPPAGGGRGGRGSGTPTPTGTSVYKSTDGGITWKELEGGGLPRLTASRTSIAVAAHTDARRVYLIDNNGLYRSDDGGDSWRQMDSTDTRIRNGQGGYNCGVLVDAEDPDVVYTFNTAAYKSTDGGNTFTGFRGAPGGDDPQAGWIDPVNSKRILLGYDQGAIVTLDGGENWSSWYNQSTEQVYHISTDNRFPYWIYATQQDAGAIRTRARGNLGAVTPLDWGPVNGWEWGTIIPDPSDPNTVYASGSGIVKISYPSEQWINVSPAIDPQVHARGTSSAPLVWAPWNRRQLLAGMQWVMSTTDGGAHWAKLSPDLGWPRGMTPPPDTATPQPGSFPAGAIESIVATSLGGRVIWVGTNNGLIKVTRDEGKTWSDVSITDLPFAARGLVEGLDVSPTVPGEAYASVSLIRAGDWEPLLYRTKDWGRTWTKIINGLRSNEPAGSMVRAVRADPVHAGLLYAGTETGMYVSFDDGDTWQAMGGNLPNTSYRSIAFAGNDVIVGTYGRGIWVLDGGAVLRQMTPAVADEPVHLFRPDPAVRVRRNVNADTPFPRDVPQAPNPPDGAIVYYSLAAKPSGDITIDVLDSAGTAIRHYTSAPGVAVPEAARPPEPNWWIAPPYSLPAEVGLNRMAWDFRYDSPPAFTHSFEINANPGQTPAAPQGAFAGPGRYTVRLAVNGKAYTQPLVVTNDPRSPASGAALAAQSALVAKVQRAVETAWAGYQQVDSMRAALTAAMPKDTASAAAHAIRVFSTAIDSVGGGGRGGPGAGGGGGRGARGSTPPTFRAVHGRLVALLMGQENADHAPTAAMHAAWNSACKDLGSAASRWTAVNGRPIADLNAALAKAGIKAVPAGRGVAPPKC